MDFFPCELATFPALLKEGILSFLPFSEVWLKFHEYFFPQNIGEQLPPGILYRAQVISFGPTRTLRSPVTLFPGQLFRFRSPDGIAGADAGQCHPGKQVCIWSYGNIN